MLYKIKEFLLWFERFGGKIIREDGFFFVVIIILNLPIIYFVEDFYTGVANFYFGVFAIFFITVVIHLIPLKIRRLFQIVLIIIFAVHFVIDVFLLQKFGLPMNVDMLQIFLGTNPLTAKAFLLEYVANFSVLGSLAAFVLATMALIIGLKKFFATCSNERLKRLTFGLLIILFLPMTICIYFIMNFLIAISSDLLVKTTICKTVEDVYHLNHTAPIGNEAKIFEQMDKQLESEKILSNSSNIPWVIFVLGESTDRNHMQLYGYNLPTTPRLTARHERGEIFRFNDVIACANHTSAAMARMFTFAEKEDPLNDWYYKANIFDILRRAGYHTVWLSNQSPIGLWGNFDKYFSVRCDEKFFIEGENTVGNQRQVDGVLLPVLDEFVKKSTSEKNFYLIHLYGTHEKFKLRYPTEFEKFSADDEHKPEESWRQVTAEYDNAVLYNDFIVDEIIRRFEDKNAILIYISDHGTEVFDGRDFFGHSIEEVGNVHMIEIPVLVWVSKEFRERYPEKIFALNTALDRPDRTDFWIHSLLDIMNIRTTSFDSTKSIINENFDSSRIRIYSGKVYSKNTHLVE